MKPSTTVILDTRRQKQDGTFPVKVRVTHNRQQKYYPTGVNMKVDAWEKLNDKKLTKAERNLKEYLSSCQGKATTIIEELKTFSFELFEARYARKRTINGAMFDQYTDYIEQLTREGRISTAKSYQNSLNSLLQYNKRISFELVSVSFLNEYEKWMTTNGNSLTTVGIYMRNLRSIYNLAIADGAIAAELYPFGKRKYQIPSSRNIKKALAIADVKKLLHYRAPEGATMQKSKDLWLFSYLCNGINIKDIARLKFKNWDGEFLHIIRAKTERSTKTNTKAISIHLLPQAIEVINRWGNKDNDGNNYIFGILQQGMTPEQEYNAIQQCTKTINKYIRIIAGELGIEKDITTYTARHTFSTVLKRSGASVEFIQEALGHTDKSTTEAYLDSFEEDTKKHFSSKLLDFKD
ncbi:MAG: site-specific integrase [Bacteroidetes bacterium]|nr:site-specific integrase [Bacteroidota bacterium]